MSNQFKFFLLLFIPFLSFNLFAQSKADKIDELMNYCYDNGIFNGTILVADEGEIIYRKAFGVTNKENNEMLEPDYQFYLGSVSKQFTTMAIMLLKFEGKLEYSDQLIKYFPEFKSFASDITIKHMMTHTSGLPDHYRFVEPKKGLSNEDAIQALLKHGELDFDPGDKYRYSNGAYVMLAMIAENASGTTLHNYLHEKVFAPLEMNSTMVYDEKYEITKQAVGYNEFGIKDDYHFFTTGAGGIYSTIDDLYKWDQALYSDKIIPQEFIEEAFTPTMLNDSSLSYYGYGWRLNKSSNKVAHAGGLAGFRAFIQRDPDKNSSIIFCTNFGNALNMGGVIDGINAILENNSFVFPKVPITLKMHKEIESKGITGAISSYNEAKKNYAEKYDFAEYLLNRMGYYYLYNLNDVDTAIEIFKVNVAAYPDAFNVYDSLGEAYKVKGNIELAIKNYQKSYDLDNSNTNALKVIKELKGN